MGFKSVMKKVGKVALAAAPYVAAPFTGGASLAFAPMANKALGAWNQHDAESKAAKGLAPSNFDKYLGIGADMAGMAGGLGAFGNMGGGNFSAAKFSGAGQPAWQGAIAQTGNEAINRIMSGRNQGGGSQYGGTPPFVPQGGGMGTMSGGNPGNVMDRGGGMRGNAGIGPSQAQLNPMGMMDQNNPNLSAFIGQGRAEAIQNQPFRRGYDVNYLGSDDETPYTTRMPRIGPTPPRRSGGGAKKRQQES